MKELIIKNDNDDKYCAAFLAANIEIIIAELDNRSGMTSFSRTANTILYMVLPRYHQGHVERVDVITTSALEEAAFIRIILEQARHLTESIRLRDPFFADWTHNILTSFLKQAAIKYSERRLQIKIIGEGVS